MNLGVDGLDVELEVGGDLVAVGTPPVEAVARVHLAHVLPVHSNYGLIWSKNN